MFSSLVEGLTRPVDTYLGMTQQSSQLAAFTPHACSWEIEHRSA